MQPEVGGEELGHQHLGEQADVVVLVAGVPQRVRRALDVGADGHDGRAALAVHAQQLVLPTRPRQQQQPVVGGLREVDVDMAPVAGLAARTPGDEDPRAA